ncbi:unnamed protein product [Caenorhabditis brenneri]
MGKSCLKIQRNGEKSKDLLLWGTYENPKDDFTQTFYWNRGIRIKFKGNIVKCRISIHPTSGLPVFWFHSDHRKIVPLALHDAICKMFKISNKLQIISDLLEFPNIEVVDNFKETGYSLPSADQYEEFFSNVTIKNCASLVTWCSFNNRKINSEDIGPNLIKTNHLVCWNSDWLTEDWLFKFEGKSAIFYNVVELNNESVISLTKKWIDGKFPSLVSLMIGLGSTSEDQNFFDKVKILENFETFPWNPNERAARFKYPSSATQKVDKDILDCSQEVDIKRNCDGLLATVIVEPLWFQFFVWHEPFAVSIPRTCKDPFTNKTFFEYGDLEF